MDQLLVKLQAGFKRHSRPMQTTAGAYLKVGGTVRISGGVPEKHPGVSMVLPFTTGPALMAGGA